jgi:hypothetical protein
MKPGRPLRRLPSDFCAARRRALIVGDPSQILPVVPLGERFVRELRARYGVHADWVANGEDGGSLQTLADRASRHGATRVSMGEKQWIGIPLYVHRPHEGEH